ncbi:PilZ domain-containing protein [Pseudoalteromonas phenolica]|uniref:PilZ domain-containing protein n=1 Tax=Pseudoalteromonas phenolica TaxID=161398 RepID=A0A4Q7IKH9_9GAMM|nr:PilZ domain-containing protein [Pseudoalteromonas phenolica]RZQ52191.1 PilZ domain-containing protein [Pseudoalteromonas phenolica]TMN89382.1 PilZ domain-containing protein [Pseudoalteromonas phenolica]
MLYEDKRRFMRMMVNAEAKISILEQQITLTGRCIDLSATGLSVAVEEPLEVETVVDVHINSTSASIPPLNAHTKIVRCTQEEEGQYILGLEIIQFN